MWVEEGYITVIFKQGGQYLFANLERNDTLRCGEYNEATKLGENYFQYTRYAFQGEENGPRTSCNKRREIFTFSFHVNNNVINYTGSINVQNVPSWSRQMIRLWPTDIVAHNAKFKTKKCS